MRRIRLRFVPGLFIEFVDRGGALKRIVEWAEKGVVNVQVVYGPEGCGKTAWLKQASQMFKEMGFDVIYINPVEKEVLAEVGIRGIRERILDVVEHVPDGWIRVVEALILFAKELVKAGRKRLAVIADDVFQVIGISKAATYVKGLLGLIEYPPAECESIVAIVATSEGLSRRDWSS